MHLVITTREDPSLPLARLRARDQLTELRAADLRFTPAEAAEFLNRVMGLNLAAEQVAALEARTEGWIAGLQLAALSLRGRTDAARFVQSFAGDNRYIVEYLVEEVLKLQAQPVRSFLLQTSILERLSGPLCDAVTGRDDSNTLLDVLERGNLFVMPLDDKRRWFRYHHLFADVLSAQVMQEQPAQVSLLHQRASDWCADHGLPADAIRHALAAKDFERAARLVELSWPAMDGSFQSATWLGWARALPRELVRTRPVLSAAYGWALLNAGELEAAEDPLQEAERWLDMVAEQRRRLETSASAGLAEMVVVDEEQFRTLPASLATARSYLAQASGDVASSVKYGHRALDLLPSDDYLRRGPAAALLGLAQWASGDLDAAYRTLVDAGIGFQKAGNFYFAISVTYGLGDIRTVQGRLQDAINAYAQALQLTLAQGEPLLRGVADLYLGLGELYHEQGKSEAALQHLQRSEELGEQAGLSDWRYRMHRAQARLAVSAGDLSGALDQLEQAERRYRRSPVPDLRPLAAMKARVWAAQGRLRKAMRWVQERGLAAGDKLRFLREYEHITLARVLLALHAHEPAKDTINEAVQLLERLQGAAEAGGRRGSAIEIGVLRALAYEAQGDLSAALEALKHALRTAEPEGYVHIFVDEGPRMAHLLSAAAAQGIMPGYCARLLAAFASREAESSPPTGRLMPRPAAPVPSLVEPLSARELEILQLIAQGYSNEAISVQLFLALSTVKGHNRNIFGKLQARSRTEAVARARDLGLL
jgi:LuxR family maltose regulon positive regulatory protein